MLSAAYIQHTHAHTAQSQLVRESVTEVQTESKLRSASALMGRGQGLQRLAELT